MIQISGTLPSSMAEGSLPGDWAGLLAVTGTSGGIAAVEAIGPGALHLALAWNAAQGTLTLRPGAPVDFEAFAAAAAAPESLTRMALIGFWGDGGTSHDQSREESAKESFAPAPGVVDELEEAEI